MKTFIGVCFLFLVVCSSSYHVDNDYAGFDFAALKASL